MVVTLLRNTLIEMESLFAGRGQQSFPQDVFRRVVGKLEIMGTRVD